jgi:hypothetical protein
MALPIEVVDFGLNMSKTPIEVALPGRQCDCNLDVLL